MPIYAFRCAACGHAFDRLQKLADPDPTQCPECGQPAVERQLTAPSFRLAGGGWYETDFKQDGKRNLAGDGAKPADPKTEAKKKAETAPAAKSEPKPTVGKPDSP